MSTGRILWIDNDRAYLRPHQQVLEAEGYEVTVLGTVSEATSALVDKDYDLIIIDVMIPISESDEAEGYSPELTDHGHKTGLAFYARHRDELIARGISAIVMTVRFDKSIFDEFIAAGLPDEFFVTKYSMVDPWTLLEMVKGVIETGASPRNEPNPLEVSGQ